jgi:gluconokinase
VNTSRFVVLSIDVGSSSVRASLYDVQGGPIAGTASRRPHRFVFSAGGRAESDADALAGLVESCIDESLQHLCEVAGDAKIVAVALCTFLHGLIGANREGRALTPVITWADTRSSDQADHLGAMVDPEEILQRTGCPLHPVYFPSKILWIRENLPQLFQVIDWWCSIGEYCIRRFTGFQSCSFSMASAFGLFNRRTSGWDRELLGALGLDEASFSPLRDMDSPVQGLLPPFAKRWPRLRGAVWFPALGDGACSNVGCGCATQDRAALMIGTTGALRAVRPAGDSLVPAGLWSYRLDRSRELVGGVLGDGGNLFEWMRSTLNIGLTNEEIDRALLAAEPAGHGLTILPFLAGERSTGWNSRARGAVNGLRFQTSSLDILQASTEAVAYRFLAIMRVLQTVAPAVREVICTGGVLLGSTASVQILADVLELPLSCVDEPEASSRGAAVLALEALGYILATETSRPAVVRMFLPRAEAAEAHHAAFLKQERLREAVLGITS